MDFQSCAVVVFCVCTWCWRKLCVLDSCGGRKNGELVGGVKIHFSKRDPGVRIHIDIQTSRCGIECGLKVGIA